jgi:hypothetical protein
MQVSILMKPSFLNSIDMMTEKYQGGKIKFSKMQKGL